MILQYYTYYIVTFSTRQNDNNYNDIMYNFNIMIFGCHNIFTYVL